MAIIDSPPDAVEMIQSGTYLRYWTETHPYVFECWPNERFDNNYITMQETMAAWCDEQGFDYISQQLVDRLVMKFCHKEHAALFRLRWQ